jgi:hypothetical protein
LKHYHIPKNLQELLDGPEWPVEYGPSEDADMVPAPRLVLRTEDRCPHCNTHPGKAASSGLP